MDAARARGIKRMALVFAGTIVLASTLSMASIAASPVTEQDLQAHGRMGEVSIDLDVAESEDKKIDLGKSYPRSYSVTNNGQACYVRIDAHVGMDGKEMRLEQDAETNEGWIRAADGYWYRLDPIEPGDTVTFNGKIYYPSEKEWLEDLNAGEEYRLQEVVYASAIQSANFSPDYEAIEPWGESSAEIVTEQIGQGGR